MKTSILILAIILFLTANLAFGQETYDIIFPTTESSRNQICQSFNQVFSRKPKEVKFAVKQVNASIFIETNDKNWFSSLFKNANDGLAIDVVPRNRYDCDVQEIKKSQIRGLLLKPTYAQKIKGGLRKTNNGMFRVLVGRLPASLVNDDLEFNILFLSNKRLCQYYIIYDLESYPWDLLDMGMYLDSLTYNDKKIKITEDDSYILKNKALKFKIPFEKNKSLYSQDDIKPLYDSLRLTDFNIKTINIKAYSSIEGSLTRNIELQEHRANSIAQALQAFQKPTIKTNISSSENWVEFFNDIGNTKYENLKTLSKSVIKSKVVGQLSKELEPILKNHRKAVIELLLEKKDRYKAMTAEELLKEFNKTVASNNVDKALEIQNSIFKRLNNKEVSPDFLKKMEVPTQEKFVKIFNKNSAIRFMLDIRQSLIVYNDLLQLEELAPKNGEVKYNIAAIKIRLWRYNAIQVDVKKLETQINSLKNYGIDQSLRTRMFVNINIIKAERLMRERKYEAKDKSVKFISDNYKKFPLSNYDYLSLAQFFSYYANTGLSTRLLEDKVKTIDINEDLLFYYLNLTIVDNELTKKDDYRTIMLNAFNLNKERYCKLYGTFGSGGVMFQLLENEYLRSSYCENCSN